MLKLNFCTKKKNAIIHIHIQTYFVLSLKYLFYNWFLVLYIIYVIGMIHIMRNISFKCWILVDTRYYESLEILVLIADVVVYVYHKILGQFISIH